MANDGSASVTVIHGATNNTTTVAAGSEPQAVAVNPDTNRIYVANYNADNVTVIQGATNTTSTVAAGTRPQAVAANPVTGRICVANYGSGDVTVIDEQQVESIPLHATIIGLIGFTGNETISHTPNFDFTASSSFSPQGDDPGQSPVPGGHLARRLDRGHQPG